MPSSQGLMHRRALGATGLTVSTLGLGSSPFRNGKARDWSTLIQRAVDRGITYYDTARSYVNGEEALAHLPSSTKYELVVTTKTGARGGTFCLKDLETSLRTMRRTYVDVWMTHMLVSAEEYELCTALGGFCDIATAAKRAGLVRAIGASFHSSTSLILRAIEERAFDVVMFPFNVIGRETVFGSSIASYREVLFPAARLAGVGIVVMKVLAGGELRHGATNLSFLEDPATGTNVQGGAIRYALAHPDIATSVVGMSDLRELEANVAAAVGLGDEEELADAWAQRVAEISDASECTRCGLCLEVCPEGIEIPKVFRLFDQARLFGMPGVARYKYRLMERDAAACRRCRRCQDVCPEEFDIAGLLDKAHLALH